MSEPIRAQTLFQALQAPLELTWVAGKAGAKRVLSDTPDQGIPLVGRLNWIQPPRLQVVGTEEMRFLRTLDIAARGVLIRQLLMPREGVVLVCGDLDDATILRDMAEETGTPLWHTPMPPAVALERLSDFQRSLGASVLVHGELLEVFGLGVLITGASGIGKSELALELISRGHRLIADDTPELTRVAPNVIEGTCPESLRDFLEVRGLGVLNIRRMFGDSAVKRNKRVRLIVELVRFEEMSLPAELRLNGARSQRRILDVELPTLSLPIAPGRNLAVLVECAVRDHIQRLKGYRAEEELTERLQQQMTAKLPCV